MHTLIIVGDPNYILYALNRALIKSWSAFQHKNVLRKYQPLLKARADTIQERVLQNSIGVDINNVCVSSVQGQIPPSHSCPVPELGMLRPSGI